MHLLANSYMCPDPRLNLQSCVSGLPALKSLCVYDSEAIVAHDAIEKTHQQDLVIKLLKCT